MSPNTADYGCEQRQVIDPQPVRRLVATSVIHLCDAHGEWPVFRVHRRESCFAADQLSVEPEFDKSVRRVAMHVEGNLKPATFGDD
jgi:hypothetical protein